MMTSESTSRIRRVRLDDGHDRDVVATGFDGGDRPIERVDVGGVRDPRGVAEVGTVLLRPVGEHIAADRGLAHVVAIGGVRHPLQRERVPLARVGVVAGGGEVVPVVRGTQAHEYGIRIAEVGGSHRGDLAVRVVLDGVGEHRAEDALGRFNAQGGAFGVLGRTEQTGAAHVEGVRDVDGLVGPVRALGDGAVVLQHDDGVQLSIEARGDVRLVPDRRLRLLEVDERAVEEAGSEVRGEDPGTGLGPAGIGILVDLAGLEALGPEVVRLQQEGRVVHAAEHVDAVLQHREVPLDRVHVFGTPRGRDECALVLRAGHDAPVGDDRTAEADLVADHRQRLGVVGGADGLVAEQRVAVAVEHDRVVRHHAERVRGGREHGGVLLEVVSGEDLVLADGRVRLASALARTVTRYVLDGGRHGAGAPSEVLAGFVVAALEALDVGGGEFLREIGVFAERSRDTQPARLGGEIDLRAECVRDAQCAVLLGDHTTELLHRLGREGRREAEHGRPQRNAGPGLGVGRVRLCLRAGVGREVRGDVRHVRRREALHIRLHRVDPGDVLLDIRAAGVEHVAEVVFGEVRLLRVGQAVARGPLVRAEEHESGDLLGGERLGVGRCPLGRLDPPVLERVEFVVSVQVLERVGRAGVLHLEDLDRAVRRVRERRAALRVLDDHEVGRTIRGVARRVRSWFFGSECASGEGDRKSEAGDQRDPLLGHGLHWPFLSSSTDTRTRHARGCWPRLWDRSVDRRTH